MSRQFNSSLAEYTTQLDEKTLNLFMEFSGHFKDFHSLRSSFENYIMDTETENLNKITGDQRVYRDYRAYMREHYNRLKKPWPVAFNGFMEQYLKPKPQVYNHFVVTGEEALARVKEFYKFLDANKVMSKNNVIQKPILNSNVEDLEKEVRVLYRKKAMWRMIKTGESEYSSHFDTWKRELNDKLIQIVRYHIDTVQQKKGMDAKREHTVYELYRVLVRFHKCFHTEGYTFASTQGACDRFLSAVFRKALDLMKDDGIPEPMYFFAIVRPDLVADDCYPLVNTKNPLFEKTDYERLLTVRPYRKHSWCQKFWDTKFHEAFW